MFGSFFCKACCLFDSNTSKRQFHCNGCGVCKTGGRENFFHCRSCKTCVSIQVRHLHNHTPDNTHHCPVCNDLIDPTSDSLKTKLKCGHVMHRHCFKDLSAQGETCPLCIKEKATAAASTVRSSFSSPRFMNKISVDVESVSSSIAQMTLK